MPRRRLALPLLAVTTAAGVLVASGCTAVPDGDDGPAVTTRAPESAVTLVAEPTPEARALATSSALFEASSLVVLVPAGDAAAVAEAGGKAEAWGVPVLLSAEEAADGSGAEAGEAALAAELERLGVERVATVAGASSPEVPGAEVEPVDDVTEGERPDPAEPREDTLLLVAPGEEGSAAASTARAAGADVQAVPGGGTDLQSPDSIDLLHGSTTTRTVLLGSDFGAQAEAAWSVSAARTGVQLPGGGQRVFDDRRYVALYGAPEAPVLGVLGEQGPEAAAQRAAQLTAEYAPVSDRPVVPMMEIIATVAAGDAGPDGDYSNELSVDALLPYVEAAEAAGQYVVLDLQPGRTDFLTQAKRYEELLRRPGVGLALDPEWRLAPDQVHLRQIGGVDAAEVDAVSTWLADLVQQEALPQKMFVLHQFRSSMLRDRSSIDVSRPELATVVHVDGQGSQPDKQATWKALHDGAPEGLRWGWKNFYDEDTPMLTPAQTMADVAPVPDIVTYQ